MYIPASLENILRHVEAATAEVNKASDKRKTLKAYSNLLGICDTLREEVKAERDLAKTLVDTEQDKNMVEGRDQKNKKRWTNDKKEQVAYIEANLDGIIASSLDVITKQLKGAVDQERCSFHEKRGTYFAGFNLVWSDAYVCVVATDISNDASDNVWYCEIKADGTMVSLNESTELMNAVAEILYDKIDYPGK